MGCGYFISNKLFEKVLEREFVKLREEAIELRREIKEELNERGMLRSSYAINSIYKELGKFIEGKIERYIVSLRELKVNNIYSKRKIKKSYDLIIEDYKTYVKEILDDCKKDLKKMRMSEGDYENLIENGEERVKSLSKDLNSQVDILSELLSDLGVKYAKSASFIAAIALLVSILALCGLIK
ncbi:MAG: hypothetical protein N4A47_03375 [Clostridia bacterium]|nr:hypothetical protein [Clostridia bacterium]